ncbi:MAG TPA: hypothetical protein VJ697_10120 [Nitrososphaeraceae archaeon]|nr:hypothetical protein [Nitrososphaeraceae archaeon]
MTGINHSEHEDISISIIDDSNFQLSLPSNHSKMPKIAIWKDIRLEYLDIPTALIEILQIHGFTIEIILEYGPSIIAEMLGIDDYVAQIVFNEAILFKGK